MIHPVPLLRSSSPVEPMRPCLGGHIDAAPASLDDEGFGPMGISGTNQAASAPALLRFAFRVATHVQGWLPAGWPLPRGCRTLSVKGFRSHDHPPLCSPDATRATFDPQLTLCPRRAWCERYTCVLQGQKSLLSSTTRGKSVAAEVRKRVEHAIGETGLNRTFTASISKVVCYVTRYSRPT